MGSTESFELFSDNSLIIEKLGLNDFNMDQAMGFIQQCVQSNVHPDMVAELFNASDNPILHKIAKKLTIGDSLPK